MNTHIEQRDNADMFYIRLGEKITDARAMRGMKQSELAQAVGLTRSSIANIESGRQRMLAHTLVDIAAALRMPPEWFMFTS